MKLLSISLISAGLCGVASAAVSVGAVNYTGSPIAGTGTPIVNLDGTPLTTNIYFGAFTTTTPDFGGSATDIINAFSQNGSGLANNFPQAGLFNGSIGDAATSTDGSDIFTGTEIFMLIGDGASLAASTEVIVFSSGINWPQEIEGTGAVVPEITIGEGNLERGGTTTFTGGVAPFDVWNGTTGITFVPEPSAFVLSLLGFLGLMRRRR